MEWTGPRVKQELVAAFECSYDVMGHVAPAQFGNSWPSYIVEETDLWHQRLSGTNTIGRMRARIQRKAREVSSMTAVLVGMKLPGGRQTKPWLAEFLRPASWEFRCLERFAIDKAECNLRDVRYSMQKSADRARCPKNTFKSRVDRAAEMIAAKLNEMGVRAWD